MFNVLRLTIYALSVMSNLSVYDPLATYITPYRKDAIHCVLPFRFNLLCLNLVCLIYCILAFYHVLFITFLFRSDTKFFIYKLTKNLFTS